MDAYDLLLSLAMMLPVGGCGYGPALEVDSTHEALVLANGVQQNGIHQNGVHQNGVHQNGVRQNGVLLGPISIVGSELIASGGTVGLVSGTSLVGATLVGELDNGNTFELRIDSVSQDAASGSWLYGVSAQLDGTTWQPLC